MPVSRLPLNIQEFSQISSLAASTTKNLGSIDVDKIRTLTTTIKGTTNTSAILGLRLNLFYSPTGNVDEFDTQPLEFFDLDIVAASNTQRTKTFQNLPEVGKIRFQVENLDTGQAATDIKVWIGVSYWEQESSEIVAEVIN